MLYIIAGNLKKSTFFSSIYHKQISLAAKMHNLFRHFLYKVYSVILRNFAFDKIHLCNTAKTALFKGRFCTVLPKLQFSCCVLLCVYGLQSICEIVFLWWTHHFKIPIALFSTFIFTLSVSPPNSPSRVQEVACLKRNSISLVLKYSKYGLL